MKLVEELEKTKRKRFAKNKKKAWRKKINIDDVEASLEDKRREERFGGALGERPFEELFSLDIVTTDVQNTGTKAFIAEPVSKKSRGKKKEVWLLKCHQFLNGLPGVKAISKKGGIMKQKQMRSIKYARKVSKNTPKAQMQRTALLQQRKKALKQKKTPKGPLEFKKDLWHCNKENVKNVQHFGEVGNSFVMDPILYHKAQTGQGKIKIPGIRFANPTPLPAIVLPHPGASYNPSYKDHQKLLRSAVNVEKKRERAVQKEERRIAKYLPTSKDGITERERIDEMLEGLPFPFNPNQTEEEEQEEEGKVKMEESEENVTCVGRNKPQKKSKQTRKKAKKEKIKLQLRQQEKKRKRMESEVDKVKHFTKQIKKAEEELEIQEMKKLKKAKLNKLKTKRLSKQKFQKEDILVPLGFELTGSLRKMQPKRDLIKSTFNNFQRMNMVAPGVKVKRVKRKVKMYEKRSHKDIMKNFINSLNEK